MFAGGDVIRNVLLFRWHTRITALYCVQLAISSVCTVTLTVHMSRRSTRSKKLSFMSTFKLYFHVLVGNNITNGNFKAHLSCHRKNTQKIEEYRINKVNFHYSDKPMDAWDCTKTRINLVVICS